MLRSGSICGLGLLLLAAAAAAQTPSLSGEFRINTYTTQNQGFSAIAPNDAGGFTVVWSSFGQDGSMNGVFGQRLDGLASPVDAEFPVNTYTTSIQVYPSAAATGDGTFVVVWQSSGQGDYTYDIFGQRFGSDGSKVGDEFQVNTETLHAQFDQKVAADASGNFVVVWSTLVSIDDNDVHAQRFDGSGAKLGDEFRVNAYTTGAQFLPSIASSPDGSFVVVWMSRYQTGGDSEDIVGQRFDNAGSKIGGEFFVNTYTTGGQTNPSIAIGRAGNFVVVWAGQGLGDSVIGVFGQRFNSAAEEVGPEFSINTFTTGSQGHPSATFDRTGGFVVVWNSYDQDGSSGGVFGQRFDRQARKIGPEFQLNTYTSGTQSFGQVSDDDGGFLVTWSSYLQDGSSFGIYGRRQMFVPGAMKVDAHSGPGTSADSNGVLEPGEAVLVEPSWKSSTSFSGGLGPTGTIKNLAGPAGGIYLLNDSAARYGVISAGDRFNCYDGTFDHDCYVVTVGGTRPGVHWDATFEEDLNYGGGEIRTLHIGDSFTDVPRTQTFYRKIETVLHAGITAGCGGTKYCPGDPVTRGQMAIFVARGIAGGSEYVPTTGICLGAPYNCSPGGNSLFTDVLPTDSFCKHVHYIALQNVTLGCAQLKYCPNDPVTREQMASFMAKAVVAPKGAAGVPIQFEVPGAGISYSCDPANPNIHFTDVPASNSFCKHIHYLWARGMVSGCSATQYCRGQNVTRDAMAKFLANGFELDLYSP